MRPALILSLVVAISCTTLAVHADPSLQDTLLSAAGGHSGTIGVVVLDLASGETASLNADLRFTSASLYKLFVLETAEAAIDDGSLDPNEVLTLSAATAAADPYSDLEAGTRISVDCALQTMIEMSGNSAADLVVRRLGTSAVNARIAADGLSNTAISADGAFTSPGDTASLLAAIARGASVSGPASQRMLQLLSAQQHNDRIPAPLPMGIRVAHKTGELPGLRHDAAIIFAPSGAYVLVVMVEDAPSESDARGTIVDVSAAVYAAHEPGFQPSPDAPPPRIAEQVLRVPDGQGRLALLGDPRTETRVLPATVQTAADVPEPIRLRPELVPDLTALQQAASQAGVGFWVRAGFRQPTDAEAAYAVPTEWFLSCPIEQPPRAADRSILPADAASARAHQAWLGTAFAITDRQSGAPTFPDDTASPAWQWLLQHAAEYGFVPALPESSSSDTHEPWTLRWVGRDVARRLAPLDSADHDQRAGAELSRAEADLVAQDLSAAQPPAWGLADACWTIATTSTRGCPSRWYFLGLPLS